MRQLLKVHGKGLMEEMPSAVAMALSLGNSACDNAGFATQVEIARTDTASLLLDPPVILPAEFVSSEDLNSSNTPAIETGRHGNRNGWGGSDAINQECEDYEILSAVDDGNNCDDDLLNLDSNPSLSFPSPVEIQDTGSGQIVAKIVNFDIPNGSDVKVPAAVSSGKNLAGSARSIFEVECLPLWGSVCICGRRPEMEDAVAAVPSAINIPLKMLIGDHQAINRMSQSLSHLTGHFFGVYDGHGGSQVAGYLRDQIHLALAEEIETINNDLTDGRMKGNGQVQWETVFTRCFVKVDDKVGGKVRRGITLCDTDVSGQIFEPVAPETVGSTAVVALMCSSHLIVANCGDSRAVLCRGKEVMPLSTDHKPSREDEYARIEAAGGKVIQWNGYRVFGVLAMSRSIGDRYLKPWIIPDPEVMLVPRSREDECLVLASDGLWDVMTNEEVCEVARRRILLWHKKNGTAPLTERGKGVDPASQAAAEYLSALALQKGSKDNISVIVVDLKAQRKFKNRGG